jgi:FkbM family methyltransferase
MNSDNTLFLVLKTLAKVVLGRGVRRSYSQDGEDILARAFLKKRNGFYVDVGAYHPILYSNTYNFYRRGWKGIVVDPNERMRPLYSFFRPRDIFVANGVSDKNETRTYYAFSDGAYNTFSEAEAKERMENPHLKFLGKREMRCRTLASILEEHSVTSIDFMTIDVEGLDLMVLESHAWSIRPRVIAVEDNDFLVEELDKSRVYQFLRAQGYRMVAMSPRTLIFEDSEGVV